MHRLFQPIQGWFKRYVSPHYVADRPCGDSMREKDRFPLLFVGCLKSDLCRFISIECPIMQRLTLLFVRQKTRSPPSFGLVNGRGLTRACEKRQLA